MYPTAIVTTDAATEPVGSWDPTTGSVISTTNTTNKLILTQKASSIVYNANPYKVSLNLSSSGTTGLPIPMLQTYYGCVIPASAAGKTMLAFNGNGGLSVSRSSTADPDLTAELHLVVNGLDCIIGSITLSGATTSGVIPYVATQIVGADTATTTSITSAYILFSYSGGTSSGGTYSYNAQSLYLKYSQCTMPVFAEQTDPWQMLGYLSRSIQQAATQAATAAATQAATAAATQAATEAATEAATQAATAAATQAATAAATQAATEAATEAATQAATAAATQAATAAATQAATEPETTTTTTTTTEGSNM